MTLACQLEALTQQIGKYAGSGHACLESGTIKLAFTHFRDKSFNVPELDPAVRFYSEAIGLCLNRIMDDVAELSGSSCMIYLLANQENSAAASFPSAVCHYARHWTPVHIDFAVDDLEGAVDRAVRAGAVCKSEKVEWRGSRCMTFSDPFGHGFA